MLGIRNVQIGELVSLHFTLIAAPHEYGQWSNRAQCVMRSVILGSYKDMSGAGTEQNEFGKVGRA